MSPCMWDVLRGHDLVGKQKKPSVKSRRLPSLLVELHRGFVTARGFASFAARQGTLQVEHLEERSVRSSLLMRWRKSVTSRRARCLYSGEGVLAAWNCFK
eukprot:4664911-Amphidinium_carterae.2